MVITYFLGAMLCTKKDHRTNIILFNLENSISMTDSSKKNSGYITFGSVVITYVIVKIVYKLTGFHYDFSEGLANFKLLIDVSLWCFIYFVSNFLLRKLSKR